MLPHIFHLEFHKGMSLILGGREGGTEGGRKRKERKTKWEGGMHEGGSPAMAGKGFESIDV